MQPPAPERSPQGPEQEAVPPGGAPSEGHGNESDPIALSAATLEAAITAQKATVAAFEAEFIPMRRRYERLRARLRALQGEQERRRLAASGEADRFTPIPRRSMTVDDVANGRERALPLDRPLAEFTFTSVRHQEIVLHPQGNRAAQRLTFYRDPGADTAEATTFGVAQRLLAEGWTPGVPRVILNRMAVFYPETGSSGWLRMDQMYVTEPS